MVDNVAGGELVSDIVERDAHFDHKHHNVINEVGDLIDRLCLIVSLTCDDDLGAFLTNLLENFINSLIEKISGVRAFLSLGLSALDDLHQRFEREFCVLTLVDGVIEARVRSEMASGSFLIYDYGECVLVAICRNADHVLNVA